MASFICKDIDNEVWRKVKSNAAMEGVSLKELFLGFIKTYAEQEPKRKLPEVRKRVVVPAKRAS